METANDRRKRKLGELSTRVGGIGVIARQANVSEAALDQILKGVLLPAKKDGTRSPRSLGDTAARAIEDAFDLGRGWFDTQEPAAQSDDDPGSLGPVVAATPGTAGTGAIEVSYAKGSCGGGSLADDHGDQVREWLVKEAGWFKKYGVKPGSVIAIYADGNSMADFIVDGDIVIFKKGVHDLVSGKIYAIDTPDGLRIKRVHKRSDGTIVLSSDNDNKRRFPDEEYSPERAANLHIKGAFVYRQGG